MINAYGTGEIQRLTTNRVGDATPNWSPDGQQIVFHRDVGGGHNQLLVMNPDGTAVTQITSGERRNQLASWDLLRVRVDE